MLCSTSLALYFPPSVPTDVEDPFVVKAFFMSGLLALDFLEQVDDTAEVRFLRADILLFLLLALETTDEHDTDGLFLEAFKMATRFGVNEGIFDGIAPGNTDVEDLPTLRKDRDDPENFVDIRSPVKDLARFVFLAEVFETRYDWMDEVEVATDDLGNAVSSEDIDLHFDLFKLETFFSFCKTISSFIVPFPGSGLFRSIVSYNASEAILKGSGN